MLAIFMKVEIQEDKVDPVDSMMQTEWLVKEAWYIWEENREKWWVEIRWGMRCTFYRRRA
ncbi:hypothetical protein DCAR_0207193 [Daucus carota subsp. sativus]|uniref:Uncharacterized protein n=1 Tax=Daucus carota subsp. sativus TaxID=79200 RepID=A0A166DQI2_DAUCS|nr:hypothetical protein DCAR_0207193 [Daucus carota subsp. sativus]